MCPELKQAILKTYKNISYESLKKANHYIRNILKCEYLEEDEKNKYLEIKKLLDNVISFINKKK
jgi:hypothetical protein